MVMNEETKTTSKYLSHLSGQPQSNRQRKLSEKQQSFLDNLINTKGDPKKAAELAGYAEGSYSQVVKSLKEEMIDLASHILAQSAPKAAIKLVHVMDSEEPIPQANIRLQAAQTILDRIGLGKAERVNVNHTTDGGIFILPAKQAEENIIEAEAEAVSYA
jgi:hypothetical protein|tara:strand:+ start:108 stop:587 length:480 start_codon:yes stop_codon:yes gene_type:complete